MGYKNPNVVKTIVLPIPNQENITEKEYFDEFGINIRDLFVYNEDSDRVEFKEGRSIYYLYHEYGFGEGEHDFLIRPVIMINRENQTTYYRIVFGVEIVLSELNSLIVAYGLSIKYQKSEDIFYLSYYEY